MPSRRHRRTAWLLALVLAAPGICRGQAIEAITRPSADVTLSFAHLGRIQQVLVREGDVVAAGQELASQDDSAERVQLAQLKAQAESRTRIDAAAAQLTKTREVLKKLEDAAQSDAATSFELTQARLDTTIAELSLALAHFEHEQDRRRYQEAALQVARMHLYSPIAGRVEQVFMEAGEGNNEAQQVLRVVRIDPLWIDVAVPLTMARALAVGQPAQVLFPDGGAASKGRIIHVAAVGDAASNTLMVRVQLPNPASRPAGEHVGVLFAAGSGPATRPSRPNPSHCRFNFWIPLTVPRS